eukprot:scpid98390/ scgid7157/ 
MARVLFDDVYFYPPQWSSPAEASQDVKTLCCKVRKGIEKFYNGGTRFDQFTPTYFTQLNKKNEYILTRVKVWINPIAQIRVQIKVYTPPPIQPIEIPTEVTAYVDGSLDEGPPSSED